MLLVQRPGQSHFSAGPVHHQHRRFPSTPAPALVAAATKTPGLLSLSRPQPAQRRPSPKLKHKSPQPAPAVPALQPAAEIVEKQQAKLSQSPERRGRQAAAAGPKAKTVPRSVSNRRQGPVPSTQAEPPSTPTATTKPFFDSFSTTDSGPRPPTRSTPKLSPNPSGKLANRRKQGLPSAETKAIAVPGRNKLPSFHKRASAPPAFLFPICDDISEIGNATEDDSSPPTTPTQPKRSARRSVFDDGPKTAPITSSMPNFPFGTPPKKAPRRHHVRSPSEGVFQFSDEEGTSNGSSSSDELNALFAGLLGQKRVMFASSTFLNSPDPEELPPPSF